MSTEYYEHGELSHSLEDMLMDPKFAEFAEFQEHVPMVARMAHKTDNMGESQEITGPAVSLKRVPPLLEGIVNAKFVVVADQSRWDAMDAHHQRANIHHALMHISLKHGTDGSVKVKIAGPSISEFPETVIRFGMHVRSLVEFKNTLNAAEETVFAMLPQGSGGGAARVSGGSGGDTGEVDGEADGDADGEATGDEPAHQPTRRAPSRLSALREKALNKGPV